MSATRKKTEIAGAIPLGGPPVADPNLPQVKLARPVPASLAARSAMANDLPDSDEDSNIMGPPENEQTNPFQSAPEDINSLPDN